MFYYPIMSTTKERKKVDRILSKEYQLWLHTLWNEGYLEVDDSQFHKDLTKLNNVI